MFEILISGHKITTFKTDFLYYLLLELFLPLIIYEMVSKFNFVLSPHFSK